MAYVILSYQKEVTYHRMFFALNFLKQNLNLLTIMTNFEKKNFYECSPICNTQILKKVVFKVVFSFRTVNMVQIQNIGLSNKYPTDSEFTLNI